MTPFLQNIPSPAFVNVYIEEFLVRHTPVVNNSYFLRMKSEWVQVGEG
jgi:hypothetical protein